MPASGQLTEDIDPATRMELDYARLLNEYGMPDYAEVVISKIKHPGAAIMAEVLKIQALIARGDFDKVKALIAAKPDQTGQKVWAMKLSLADGLYAWGRYAEAQAVYDLFFKAYPDGPPAALKRFYLESAYKYSQMLLLMGNEAGAVKAYSLAIKTIPKTDEKQRPIRRQLLGEKAELLVKLAEEDQAKRSTYISQVNDILNQLLWYQDLWFGKGIVMMAHIKMMENDIEGAKKLIDEYKESLVGIDKALQEEYERNPEEDLRSLSPLAECRYLLGVMMYREGARLAKAGDTEKAIILLSGKAYQKKDRKSGRMVTKRTSGAFQHFINVFINYPGTKWAPECGKRAEKTKELLAKLGKTLHYEIPPEKLEKVMSAQFMQAHSLYNQRQFRKAIDSYIDMLNLFPEGESAVGALGSLASAYLEVQTDINEIDEMHVDMILGYLGERFGLRKDLMLKAGDQVLKVAVMYEEREMLNRRDAAYDIFFKRFTLHPRAPAMIFMFGNQKFEEEDIEGAKHYYERIIKDYKHVPLYLDSLNKMAACHGKAGERIQEINVLSGLVKGLSKKPAPGYQMANARFRLATALKSLSTDYRRKGAAETGPTATKYKQLSAKYLVTSLKQFSELIKLLSNKEARRAYYKTADQEEAIEMIIQGSLFHKATCYALVVTSDPAKEKAYKQAAVKTLTDLVTQHPESAFAPAALSQMAALFAALEDLPNTERTIRRLKKDYPKSKEAENAQYMLAKTLLDMGRRQSSVREFKKMFEGGGDFTAAKILTAGKELLNAEEYQIAADAFVQVQQKSKSNAELQEALLGRGRAMIGLKEYGKAAKLLSKFVEEYKRSKNMIEASLALSQAYSELAVKQEDADKRKTLFDDAVKALKNMRRYAPQEKAAGLRARSTVGAARIQVLKYEAEKKFGAPEKAEEYLRDAVATLQMMLMTANTSDKEVRLHLEDAYHEVAPLMMTLLGMEEDRSRKAEELRNLLKDCEKYFELFVPPRYASDMRRIRTKANAQLMLVGRSTAPASTGGTSGTSTNAPAAPKAAPKATEQVKKATPANG